MLPWKIIALQQARLMLLFLLAFLVTRLIFRGIANTLQTLSLENIIIFTGAYIVSVLIRVFLI